MALLNLKSIVSRHKYSIVLMLFMCATAYAVVRFDEITAGKINVDNITVDANTISSTNTNGNIVLDPNGTGEVNFPDLTVSRALYLNSSGHIKSHTTTETELDQIANIDASLISSAEWGYVANLNQDLTTTSNVTFSQITGTLQTAAQTNITSVGTLAGLSLSDPITMTEEATPSNPSAGSRKLYFKSDGKLYSLSSGGSEAAVGSGGGGGSILFHDDGDAPPVKTSENNLLAYLFQDGLTQNLYLTFKVPASYTSGTQITLRLAYYTASTSNDVLFKTVATLIEPSDAITDTTDQYTSTTAAASNGSPSNRLNFMTLDICSASCQINSNSVAAGDLIFIRLYRDTGTDTDTATVRLVPVASEITL